MPIGKPVSLGYGLATLAAALGGYHVGYGDCGSEFRGLIHLVALASLVMSLAAAIRGARIERIGGLILFAGLCSAVYYEVFACVYNPATLLWDLAWLVLPVAGGTALPTREA